MKSPKRPNIFVMISSLFVRLFVLASLGGITRIKSRHKLALPSGGRRWRHGAQTGQQQFGRRLRAAQHLGVNDGP